MKYILIFIYVAVSVLLFVLNWDLFTTYISFDLVFGKFDVLPFLFLQIFGVVILGLFAFVDGIRDLKREAKISELQNTIVAMRKDAEIAALKREYNAILHEKKSDVLPNTNSKESS